MTTLMRFRRSGATWVHDQVESFDGWVHSRCGLRFTDDQIVEQEFLDPGDTRVTDCVQCEQERNRDHTVTAEFRPLTGPQLAVQRGPQVKVVLDSDGVAAVFVDGVEVAFPNIEVTRPGR